MVAQLTLHASDLPRTQGQRKAAADLDLSRRNKLLLALGLREQRRSGWRGSAPVRAMCCGEGASRLPLHEQRCDVSGSDTSYFPPVTIGSGDGVTTIAQMLTASMAAVPLKPLRAGYSHSPGAG